MAISFCPIISVIVPCFNVEKFVDRCLTGLLCSSYKNIEIICVDDGSKDGTFRVLKSYSKIHKNIKVVRNWWNRGVAYSRNRGLRLAKGEYVMFCDSDDVYSSDMILDMYNALILNDVDLAVCDVNIVDECKSDRAKFEHPTNAFVMDENLNGKMPINDVVILKTTRVLWNKIFKKSIIDEFKIDFPRLFMAEDVAFCLKYLLVSKSVFFLREKLYSYFRRDDSVMGKRFENTNSFYDCVRAHESVFSFMKKHKIYANKDAIDISYANEVQYALNMMEKVLTSKISSL